MKPSRLLLLPTLAASLIAGDIALGKSEDDTAAVLVRE
jgi:hypothetical protein